jgi:hypothetical protein
MRRVYMVVCLRCSSASQFWRNDHFEITKARAEKDARGEGWSKSANGWLCPEHARKI